MGAGVRAGLSRVRRPVLVPPGWCELGTAVACAVVATAAVVGAVSPARVPGLMVVSVLAVAGSATDALTGRLPDVLTLPALGLGLASLAPFGSLPTGLVGVLALGGLHAAVALAAPATLGGGDVKLAAALGGPLAATAGGRWRQLPSVRRWCSWSSRGCCGVGRRPSDPRCSGSAGSCCWREGERRADDVERWRGAAVVDGG